MCRVIGEGGGGEGEGHTHDIDGVSWTGETVGVIFDDVGGFEDALYGTGFDVELVVAEAISPVHFCISSSTSSESIH